MQVLLNVRPDYEECVDDDTIQASRTAEELRTLGVDVVVSTALAPDVSEFDLVHLFGAGPAQPTLRHALRSRAAGLPLVLTPSWRNPLEDESLGKADRDNLRLREWAMRRIPFGLADALTPSSQAELEMISSQLSAIPQRVVVVPVGVDETFAEGDGERFCARHGLSLRGFVLCVARLDARRNQLRLIEACAPLGVPLVLVGVGFEDGESYPAACRELAERLGADVRFMSYISREEVMDAYAAARVHALPSIWETIGLPSLQAAVAGCNVVSTENCGVGEYLDERARYCNPESVASIRDAISAALAAPLDDRLGEDVASRFTWRCAAETTLAVYNAVMNERESGSQDGDWRATFTPEQYIEHLESLIQLQLETIALRDGHFAGVVAHAQSLEADRKRGEEHTRSFGRHRSRVRRAFASRLKRFRR